MGECIEKIYCCDRDNNDNALRSLKAQWPVWNK